MNTSASSAIDLSYRENPDNHNLDHIPGIDGLPYFGRTIKTLSQYEELVQEHLEKFGNVSRIQMLTQRGVFVQGADNLQRIFLDKEKNFSTEMGYEQSLNQFYRGGLLMRDHDDHKFQRRIMQAAFKSDAMKNYVAIMNPIMRQHIDSWSVDEPHEFFPIIKKTLLEVGAKVFLGIADQPKLMNDISEAFLKINEGLLGLVRKNIPGTKYKAGQDGKQFLHDFFREEIPKRRGSDGVDMFTFMCNEKDDEGNYFSDEDIIAHATFLLFAAHDTTTASLSNILYYTGANPEWQEIMREECKSFNKDAIEYEDLNSMEMIDHVFHEAQRLRPSVPLMTRRTIKECDIEGIRVPEDTMIFLPNVAHHRDERFWTNPYDFDPSRFAPERAEFKKHSFAFTPFGGGAHKCMGMQFAQMLVKAFLHQLLTTRTYGYAADYKYEAEWFPLPRPKTQPVIFKKL